MRRLLIPLVFGLAGAAILVALGVWQMQRLAWKEAVLADIEARIATDPVPLPDAPEAARDRYLPVTFTGRFTGESADVLVSRKLIGPGFRIIEAFETQDARRVLVDRGFVPDDQRSAPRPLPGATVTVTGNLLWPDEITAMTPPPDLADNMWFARDLPALAETLKTEPLLIVARADTGPGIQAMPVDTTSIPNDHLMYALTWFSLALVWLGMTAFWLYRISRAQR
jgi:surfeit locus 1 family protein